MLQRTIVKLSGEALGGGKGFDNAVIDRIVCEIKKALNAGTQLALVVGGGNFWRGQAAGPGMDRVKADQIGMLATVMNALYLVEAFKRQEVRSLVMTPFPVGNMTVLYDKDTALTRMAEKTVVINAGGLGHPLFSTDTVTALRAAELNADMILFAKNIDGVYDKDPRKHTDARKYTTLTYQRAISDGLNAADMTALIIARDAGIPSLVFGLDEPDSISSACAYPETGSLHGTLLQVSGESHSE